MAQVEPGKWRWYHHVLLVMAVLTFAIMWDHLLRPSKQVEDVVLVVCAVGFVVSFAVIQLRRRRRPKV